MPSNETRGKNSLMCQVTEIADAELGRLGVLGVFASMFMGPGK